MTIYRMDHAHSEHRHHRVMAPSVGGDAGRDVAKRDKVEHYIHKQDGKIGQRNTYRPKDPFPPPG